MMAAQEFDNATTLASRWLHVDHEGSEYWYRTEPIDKPVMEIAIVRLPDGSHWQLAFRCRVKLHNWLSSEIFPKPHGKRWVFAEDRERVGVFKRRASKAFLKEQGVL